MTHRSIRIASVAAIVAAFVGLALLGVISMQMHIRTHVEPFDLGKGRTLGCVC
jgi:hypothetical protein